VPASNVAIRTLELDNIEEWAKLNNLTLNRGKSPEIVIIDPASVHRLYTH